MDVHSQEQLLVLLALEALGGNASKKAALDSLERDRLIELNAWLREAMTTRDEPRWRNMLAHARGELHGRGHISAERWNVWTLTEAGAAELVRLCGEAQESLRSGGSLQWFSARGLAFLTGRPNLEVPTDDPEEFERRVHRLTQRALARPVGEPSPGRVDRARGSVYRRDPAVAAWVLQQAGGRCELCGDAAPFESNNGPFLEIHHVVRLADDGPDIPENTVATCPNCHRELHHGRRASERVAVLY